MTNKEFANSDAKFKKACEMAGIENTSKQASKYRRQFGLAYRVGLAMKNGSYDDLDYIKRKILGSLNVEMKTAG